MTKPVKARLDLATLRAIPPRIWALGFISLQMDISSEMIHAFLPIYLLTVMGASTLTVGIIEGIAEATAAIVKIFSGALSDRLGKRKMLAALGYGLAAITKPVFPLAPAIGWLVAARFIDRVGKGIRGAPRCADSRHEPRAFCAARASDSANRWVRWGVLIGAMAVDRQTIATLAVLGIITLIALGAIMRPLIFASLQPELAEAKGVPLRFVSTAFLAIVALAVSACAQIVGVLLVFTLMVGPPAAAQQLTRGLWSGLAVSATLAVTEAWLGIALAFYTDWPVSFCIALLSALGYFVAVNAPILRAAVPS